MTLNGVMALILRYFAEFGSFQGVKVVEDVVVRSSRSLSHLLMSFLFGTGYIQYGDPQVLTFAQVSRHHA